MILENIKRMCKRKNMSLTGLENELGFSRGSISKWEKCSPSINRVEKVAKYFDISLDYLLEMKEDSKYEKALEKIQELEAKLNHLKKII